MNLARETCGPGSSAGRAGQRRLGGVAARARRGRARVGGGRGGVGAGARRGRERAGRAGPDGQRRRSSAVAGARRGGGGRAAAAAGRAGPGSSGSAGWRPGRMTLARET